MTAPVQRLSRWFIFLRLAAVPVALAYIVVNRDNFPYTGYELGAWIAWSVLVVEAIGLLAIRRQRVEPAGRVRLDLAALSLDLTVVYAFIFLFSFQPGQRLLGLSFLVVVEAGLRFGRRGGLAIAAVSAPLLTLEEGWRASQFGYEFQLEAVVLRPALLLVIGAVVGQLTADLQAEERRARARALQAERLRDELGRRVDVLEAANRCARALGSSLELEQAFKSFIRELRGLVPFDRTAIVLAEGGSAQVMAAAGKGAKKIFPPGTSRPISGSVLERVLAGQTVYREDLEERRYPEDEALLELGLRAELVAPLLLGPRAIGMLALGRSAPRSFSAEEVELAGLLGRLVATAVQNIGAYEAERATVEELRRLSTLRADFVSLVSHELRSPMAAVIGAARTLEQRWRELSVEQRQSFLALIADETNRLADLVGDVLDTSRIEAGTFTYTFADVDVGELTRETAAAAAVGQDEVQVRTTVRDPLPSVRGDAERLRQVLRNLLENAVKYSVAGGEVRVTAYAHGGRVLVDVSDEGPGVAREHHGLIFEKFGRVNSGGQGKPGSGLGLFISRSIAEAHGGSLDVHSNPRRGATFTLTLPAQANGR
jgi:signal transduction histidine kinase